MEDATERMIFPFDEERNECIGFSMMLILYFTMIIYIYLGSLVNASLKRLRTLYTMSRQEMSLRSILWFLPGFQQLANPCNLSHQWGTTRSRTVPLALLVSSFQNGLANQGSI